jgi:hypothetical protein
MSHNQKHDFHVSLDLSNVYKYTFLGMMEAVRTSETSVDNYFTRQYIPEDNSDHTRRRENLKSHILFFSEFFRFFDLANCESHVMVMS